MHYYRLARLAIFVLSSVLLSCSKQDESAPTPAPDQSKVIRYTINDPQGYLVMYEKYPGKRIQPIIGDLCKDYFRDSQPFSIVKKYQCFMVLSGGEQQLGFPNGGVEGGLSYVLFPKDSSVTNSYYPILTFPPNVIYVESEYNSDTQILSIKGMSGGSVIETVQLPGVTRTTNREGKEQFNFTYRGVKYIAIAR